MKPSTIGCTLFTILSATAAANLHRVSIDRLEREEPTTIQESIQSTLIRLASRNPSSFSSESINSNRDEYIPSRIDQRQKYLSVTGTNALSQQQQEVKEEDLVINNNGEFSISSRRSPQIDGERIVLQHNPSGIAYVGQVGIGSPPQYFHLEFDLASADTWVTQIGANCTKPNPCPQSRRFFHPTRSTTFEKIPDVPWSTIGDVIAGGGVTNKATGRLRTDVVQVAGFAVYRQVIGVADAVLGFGEKSVDGVFGLGLHGLSLYGDATPVENLIATRDMGPEIGIWLGSANRGGEISFGEADPLRYTGDLTYIDLPPDAVYWSVPVRSILIDRKSPPPSTAPTPGPVVPGKEAVPAPAPPEPTPAPKPPPPPPTISSTRDPKKSKRPPQQQTAIIFDTSSDLILLPPSIAFKTHKLLHNFLFGWYSGYSYFSGTYTVSCSLDTDLWVDLGSTLLDGGVSGIAGGPPPGPGQEESRGLPKRWFKIAAKDIVRGRVPVFGVFNVCFSGIQASNSEDDDWVFGTNWFLGNYMTFDHLKRRVGIAASQRAV